MIVIKLECVMEIDPNGESATAIGARMILSLDSDAQFNAGSILWAKTTFHDDTEDDGPPLDVSTVEIGEKPR